MIIRRKKIQLTDDEMDQPLTAKMPVKRSMRWWSQDEIEFETPPAISIFVTQKALVNACAFAASDLSNEVGGWLIGNWREDRKTGLAFIVIENILPAKHTRKGSAFLTFTHDTSGVLTPNFFDKTGQNAIWNWGDGTVEYTNTPSHDYGGATGDKTVTVYVTDDPATIVGEDGMGDTVMGILLVVSTQLPSVLVTSTE